MFLESLSCSKPYAILLTLCHFKLTLNLWSRCYYSRFKDEGIEVQRG